MNMNRPTLNINSIKKSKHSKGNGSYLFLYWEWEHYILFTILLYTVFILWLNCFTYIIFWYSATDSFRLLLERKENSIYSSLNWLIIPPFILIILFSLTSLEIDFVHNYTLFLNIAWIIWLPYCIIKILNIKKFIQTHTTNYDNKLAIILILKIEIISFFIQPCSLVIRYAFNVTAIILIRIAIMFNITNFILYPMKFLFLILETSIILFHVIVFFTIAYSYYD